MSPAAGMRSRPGSGDRTKQAQTGLDRNTAERLRSALREVPAGSLVVFLIEDRPAPETPDARRGVTRPRITPYPAITSGGVWSVMDPSGRPGPARVSTEKLLRWLGRGGRTLHRISMVTGFADLYVREGDR